MKDKNEELTPKEKFDQENFVLKSKVIMKGGIFHESEDLDPEIENMFLKNIMAFEEAEIKPVHEILGVDPKSFPPADLLSENELKAEMDRLFRLFDEHGMTYDLKEGIPLKVSYKFLTEEYLLEESSDIPGWVIDGCSGDCPSCFQADYCDVKDDIWGEEELKAERKKREGEDF